MKKTCFWGIGKWAEYYAYLFSDMIEYYIDNDISKCGDVFHGRPVKHPSEIIDWKKYHILVPSSYYKDISAQLRNYGLKEEIDFSKIDYVEQGFPKQLIVEQSKKYLGILSSYCNNLKAEKKRIIFWGWHYSYDQIANYEFLECISDNDEAYIFLVSEGHLAPFEEYRDHQRENSIFLFGLPFVFDAKTAIEGDGAEGQRDMNVRDVETCDLEVFRRQMDDDPPYKAIRGRNTTKIQYILDYVERLLNMIKPQLVIMMDSVSPIHRMVRKVAENKSIPLVYTHQGVLPGTIAFDTGGEVGESLPALFPEDFKKLYVSSEEKNYARKVLDYLYISRANRKKQPKNVSITEIHERINNNKKTVFFAAQNDVRSYMVPFNRQSKEYYSPVFKSSLEAANYIAKICADNNWNFVYKPHPMYIRSEEVEKLADNVIYIAECDINDLIDLADLTVTILSSINYISLIRNTPVLMLGYGWLRGSGCTYEAFKKDEIELRMCEAMNKGYTKEQMNSFIRHTAQCLKYYVFDDGKDRELRYGRRFPKRISDFYFLRDTITKELRVNVEITEG